MLNYMDNSNAKPNSDPKVQSAIVLVVDNNPTTAEFLVLALQPHYRTFSAFSGEDAIGFCVSHAPDLVILDLHMDGLDGLLTCKMLKAIPSMANCPIVFATADTSTEQEINCWDAGATDFINKPFVIKSLIKRVSAHIQAKLHIDLIENAVFVDQQSGFYNRRYFNDCLKKHVSLAARSNGPLSMVLFEISDDQLFKNSKSSKISDKQIKLLSQLFSQSLMRPLDILTRYSENQFAILLPDTFIFGAKHIIQKTLSAFHEMSDDEYGPALQKLNIFAGLAALDALPKNTTLDEQAEKNLLQNKRARYYSQEDYY